jgi:hypothetical protein
MRRLANVGPLVRRPVATCVRAAAVLRVSRARADLLLREGEHQSTGALVVLLVIVGWAAGQRTDRAPA